MAKSGFLVVLGAVLGLSACTVSPDPTALDFDPYEKSNRRVHEMNKRSDARAFGKVARAYGENVPAPVRRGFANLKNTWSAPSYMLHYLAQGRIERAVGALARFGINTTFGFGGLLDWGEAFGIEHRETGFNETMARYGVPEGAYLELPGGGPGTERDWAGTALDIIFNPLYLVGSGEANAAYALLSGLDIVRERYDLDSVIDEMYNRSTDSYVTQRITYLQNMRAELQDDTDMVVVEDVYDDF